MTYRVLVGFNVPTKGKAASGEIRYEPGDLVEKLVKEDAEALLAIGAIELAPSVTEGDEA
jgi:hypothetical protein